MTKYYLACNEELFVLHVFDFLEEAEKCLKEDYKDSPNLFIYERV